MNTLSKMKNQETQIMQYYRGRSQRYAPSEHGIWGPSPMEDIEMLCRAFSEKGKSFLDCGCGDGRVVLFASLGFGHAAGIEIHKGLLDAAKQAAKCLSRTNTEFILGDFMRYDLSPYDVIYIAPDRPFSLAFENKLRKELKCLLIVNSPVFLPGTLRFIRKIGSMPVYTNKAKKVRSSSTFTLPTKK